VNIGNYFPATAAPPSERNTQLSGHAGVAKNEPDQIGEAASERTSFDRVTTQH
jgi:hypothetical protein